MGIQWKVLDQLHSAGHRLRFLTNTDSRPTADVVGPGERATHVVVGDFHQDVSYERLNSAFQALQAGAQLVALQRGRFFLSDGSQHLDTGAFVAALEFAAGTSAEVVGKPSPAFCKLALRSARPAAPDGTAWVIGDDVTTDIAMGVAAGIRTVQVRTGKFALQRADCGPAPDYVIDSLADLPSLLSRWAMDVR